jgi:hypothetical protein
MEMILGGTLEGISFEKNICWGKGREGFGVGGFFFLDERRA